MGARERLLLQIAALLHDCGKYISMEKVSEVFLSDHYVYRYHWAVLYGTPDDRMCGQIQ